jgi:hypothetical protein
MNSDPTYVFVVGSPRSGTTILSEVLGRHPDVASFYEPYFIWDYRIGSGEDDVRTAAMADPPNREFIRHEFALFARKAGKPVVVEKTPENCFRIPYVQAVFPDAKWIHIIRDGRDSVESIYRETEKRRRIVEHRDIFQLFGVIDEMIRLQPFWRNRWQAIWFEVRQIASLDPRRYFNKAKWGGQGGWGPRFAGWRSARERNSAAGFAALQWRTSIEALMRDMADVPSAQRIECRYEDFVARPEEELQRLFAFAGVRPVRGLAGDITPQSIGKWRQTFTPAQIAEVGAVIGDLMIQLGQAADDGWYRSADTGAPPAGVGPDRRAGVSP